MNKIISIFLLITIVIFSAGCVAPQGAVYTSFLMPPKKVQNVNDVKNIKIVINKMKLSGFSKNSKIDLSQLVEGKISALIYKEQFLNVYDPVISKDIRLLNNKAKNHHGYSKFYANNTKFSTLQINLQMNLQKHSGTDIVKTTLRHQNYGVKYSKKGVPMSVPKGKPTYRHVKTNVPYKQYDLKANLHIQLLNTNKELLYKKDFTNITLSRKIGGDTLKTTEIPTEMELVSEALVEKLKEVITEISPHKESRQLVVNEKGDSSVVALMKGTAFSDAIVLLDKTIEKKEVELNLKKKELELVYKEKLLKAKDKKEKTSLIKSKENDILSLYKPLSPEYENMGILNEILGDLVSAKYYYELAYKYDTANSSANNSIKRVKGTLNKVNQLANIATTKYKNKDNKER